MVFVSDWGKQEWIVLILFTIFVTYNPWQPKHWKYYEKYMKQFKHGTFVFYPRPWVYKVIWGLINAMAGAGAIIAFIQLEPRSEWYVSIFSLIVANILAQKWFPVAFFEWHSRSASLLISGFIMATAGGAAGLLGYRAWEEQQMSVWASFVFWALYFFWATYAVIIIWYTIFAQWHPEKGWVIPVVFTPQKQNYQMHQMHGATSSGSYKGTVVAESKWNHGVQRMPQMGGMPQMNGMPQMGAMPQMGGMPQMNGMYTQMSAQAPQVNYQEF